MNKIKRVKDIKIKYLASPSLGVVTVGINSNHDNVLLKYDKPGKLKDLKIFNTKSEAELSLLLDEESIVEEKIKHLETNLAETLSELLSIRENIKNLYAGLRKCGNHNE